MKRLSLMLAFIVFLSVGSTYATWKFSATTMEPQSAGLQLSVDDYPPETVYITAASHISGEGTSTNLSFHESILESTVTVPKGTEITFRVTVFNNTAVEYGFDSVVSSLGTGENNSGYDNDNITFTLENLKRPYTMDGVLADDVTRIQGQQSHEFEITFKFSEDTKDFSNATLNSALNFVFKPFDSIDPEHITSPVDGALEALKRILNTPESYEKLKGIMDQSSGTGAYVGNVVGSSGNDSKVLAELFAGNLTLMLADPETGKLVKTNLTCMIKEEDLTGDSKKEITIYMTPDELEKVGVYSTIKNVYVGVFTQITDENNNVKWEQLGDLYHGTALCNDYDSNIFNGIDKSINTDRWRSSQVYHGVKSNSTIKNVITGYRNSLS